VSVEFATGFIRSSFCQHGNCVEVAASPEGEIAVRDAKNTQMGALHYTADEWLAFVRGVKAGEFDFDLIPVEESRRGS
jgi:hypothetical protein